MIKYIGSKRTLVPLIRLAASLLPVRTACDLFAGTTRVGQALRGLGLEVVSNDLATYSEALGHAYIAADESVDRARLASVLAELAALPGQDGYFTEAFCRRTRYVQPHNGRRIDAIRAAIDGYELSPVERGIVLTSLLEAADRVDSTTGLQMAYLKSWSQRSYNELELRMPEQIQGPAGNGASPGRERARPEPRRRPRLHRSAVQQPLLLLQLPRVGNARALGRPRAVRHRGQAGRLPRAKEPLQLPPPGLRCLRRAARRPAGAVADRLLQRRGLPRSASTSRSCWRSVVTSGGSRSSRSATSGPRSGSTTRAASGSAACPTCATTSISSSPVPTRRGSMQ